MELTQPLPMRNLDWDDWLSISSGIHISFMLEFQYESRSKPVVSVNDSFTHTSPPRK